MHVKRAYVLRCALLLQLKLLPVQSVTVRTYHLL